MDHSKLIQLELDTLKDMYANAAAKLKEALLDGTPWESVQESRHDLTQLEIALYNKVRQSDAHPAGNPNRASTEPELN